MNKIWGKLVGSALGFVFGGGVTGAMIGMVIGHVYDTHIDILPSHDPWDAGTPPPSFLDFGAQQKIYMNGIAVLSAKLAKCDGKVNREEINAFKQTFKITHQQEVLIGKIFDTARESPEGFEPYAFQLAQAFNNRPTVLEDILVNLFLIAAADGNPISVAEARYLKQVAYIFRYAPEDLKRVLVKTGVVMPKDETIREREREQSDNPYVILGLGKAASNEDIKSTYRNLIRKYHPDKLVADGLPPDEIALANEKVKHINAAYDAICKIRGIK